MSVFAPVQGSPGWFDDPTTPGVTRYWDGQQWTNRTFGDPLPAPGTVPPGHPGAPVFVPSTERGPRPGAKTDSGAVWALVLALLGCFWGIPSIVMGGKARRRIRYSGGRLTGDGLALAGVIIGWVQLVIGVAAVIIVLAAGAQDPGPSPYSPTTTTYEPFSPN